MFLGLGGVIKTKYVDEIFSTYLWEGNGSAGRTITNNVKTDEGTLTWIKNRSSVSQNVLTDTVRGANETLYSDSTNGNYTHSDLLTAFTATGFTVGSDAYVNGSGDDYSSWTFKKKEGFCDIVTYTGDGASAKTISHSLGSIPGLIIIKCTSHSGPDWVVWHRDFGATDFLKLNETSAKATDNEKFGGSGSVLPTATTFTIGISNDVNGSSRTYVAYVFAGGASDAATARSVHFQSSTGWMNTPAISDFAFGTGDFTIECWAKFDSTSNNGGLFNLDTGTGLGGTDGIAVGWNGSNWVMYAGNGSSQYSASTSYTTGVGHWYHAAYVRQSNTTKLYINGKELISATDSTDYSTNFALAVGGYAGTSYTFDGKISNLRILKGTALYTSSFRPPTEPLTNITNTKMLCCNSSSADGVSVGPSLTAWGSSTASTDSPFDDPAGFKFGDSKEGTITCGSYSGNSTANHEIYLGWEPQWWLVKNVTDSQNWQLLDSMRGWVIDGNDQYLVPNNTSAESPFNFGNPTPTGFNLSNASSNWQNESGKTYVYIAIRRPDPLVAKPSEAGTDVFAIDTGGGSSTIPDFDSGFPVDMALLTNVSTTDNNFVWSRLTGKDELRANAANAASTANCAVWDSNVGFGKCAFSSNSVAWMWKRGQGFDVVAYTGNYVTGRQMPHSMGVTPEMMWVKKRSSSSDGNWSVYHKGMNGGTDPEDYYTNLNGSDPEVNNFYRWADTAPNSTHFTLGTSGSVNDSGQTYIAMLFASVAGISKVGYYDGSSYSQTITTGFQPRFLIIRKSNGAGDWIVIDTTRGWAAGNDAYLMLNSNQAQATDTDFGAPTSTGFTLTVGSQWNASGSKYIYYAHA